MAIQETGVSCSVSSAIDSSFASGRFYPEGRAAYPPSPLPGALMGASGPLTRRPLPGALMGASGPREDYGRLCLLLPQLQGEGRAVGHRPPGPGHQLRRDGLPADDGKAPVVQADPLGEQLGADP